MQIECRGQGVRFRVHRVHELEGTNWVSGLECRVQGSGCKV